MATSEHSSSQNLDFADWPVSRNGTGRIGSLRDRPLFDLIAEKRSVEFCYLEAASRHRALPTHCRQMTFGNILTAYAEQAAVGRVCLAIREPGTDAIPDAMIL